MTVWQVSGVEIRGMVDPECDREVEGHQVKSRFGNPRNGMPDKMKCRRRGADPSKNELGMTGRDVTRAADLSAPGMTHLRHSDIQY
jgi:hypothetical protein